MTKQFKTIDSYNCEWTIFHDPITDEFTGYPTDLLDRNITLPIKMYWEDKMFRSQFINLSKDFFNYQLTELLND